MITLSEYKERTTRMRRFTPPWWRCVFLFVALASSALACAQPDAWVINSRDYLSDDEQIGALWSLDLENGEARLDGRSRIAEFIFIEGLSFSPDGELFGIDDSTNSLVRVGQQSGAAIAVAQSPGNLGLPQGNHDFGLTFTCDGRLLVSTDSEGLGLGLYEADPSSGEASRIGDLGAPIVDLASLGDQVFGIGRGMASEDNPAAPNLYRIDVATGEAQLIGALGPEAGLYNKAGLAADAEGNLWAVIDRRDPASPDLSLPSRVLRIDPQTGNAEAVAATSAVETGQALIGIESLAIAPPGECERGTPAGSQAIPVLSGPGAFVLFGGLFALALFSMRRSQAS